MWVHVFQKLENTGFTYIYHYSFIYPYSFMDLIANIRRLKEIKKQTVSLANSQNKNLAEEDKNKQQTAKNKNQNGEMSIKQGSNQILLKNSQMQGEERKIIEEGKNQEKGDRSKQVGNEQKGDGQAVQKMKANKVREGGLFRGLTFCFPMYNVELSKSRGKAIRITIQRLQGIVYEMEDLQQLIQTEQDNNEPILTIDFMLVDSKIPRQSIQQVIPKAIKYRGIVDFNFVFLCINQDKILNYQHYIVPQKSKQLQNYLKAKQAQKIQQMQNRNRQKVVYKFAAGIQPIDPQTAQKNQQSNSQPHHVIPQSQLETPKIQQKPKNQSQRSIVQKPRSFNKLIYESFQKLSQLFEKSDRGRSLSYSRIATVLKSIKFDITCEQDAERLKGSRFIGSKTIEKIKQFIQNGSIQKLTVMEGKQENLVCQKLEKVWGIGKIKAQQLYNRGIKSVEDLRQLAQNDPTLLTKNQKLGLKYYEDLNQRIPRQKVTRMFEYIKNILFQIVGTESDHKIEVCGSYRRGKQTCGDMDVIITRKDGTYQTKLITNLVDQLTKQGFLTDHLAMPRHDNPKQSMSYMGICKYEDQTHHRVDLKYYPVDQYAYAVLYFTGSDVFNRNMRLYAMKNGYCLSDHGMWKAQKIGTNIVTQQPGIPCYTQEEIFQKLGIKYKKPEQRSL